MIRPLVVSFGWCVAALLVMGFGRWTGCGTLRVPDEPVPSTPTRPLWSAGDLRVHLQVFNPSEGTGRATGTAGYAAAAEYVAARMAEFGLQPGVDGTFRVVYTTPLYAVRAASFTVLAPDTARLDLGLDYLPDGRSASGDRLLHRVVFDPSGAGDEPFAVPPGSAVAMLRSRTTTAYLQALRAAGVDVVLSVGALAPRPATTGIPGVVVVQVVPRIAAGLFGRTRRELEEDLRGTARTVRDLPAPARLHIETEAFPQAGALNTFGFVAGKHPAMARELVLLCADLDDFGTFSGVPTLDTGHLGVGAAALLELARQYSAFSRFGFVPERTLLFAVFSGARQGYAGLRDYFRHPLWTQAQTRSVIYLDLDRADEPDVRRLVEAHGPSFHVVSPASVDRDDRGVVLLTERRAPRRPLLVGDDEGERPAPPRLSALIDTAVTQALSVVDSAHAVLLREAVAPRSLLRLSQDTLRVPTGY